MLKLKLLILHLGIFFWIVGCASHPSVQPKLTPVGESSHGFTLSAENVIPVYWRRWGLNQYTDWGVRLGVPLSGTGIDLNRIIYKRDRRWDILNLAYNYSPNPSFDFTYYRFKLGNRAPEGTLNKIAWSGIRGMIIPDGMSGGQSVRFGLLYGRQLTKTLGFELGYFHDLQSMPISKIMDFNWDPYDTTTVSEYGKGYQSFPHKYNGLPSEYSRQVGLSMQVFMYLGPRDKKKNQ